MEQSVSEQTDPILGYYKIIILKSRLPAVKLTARQLRSAKLGCGTDLRDCVICRKPPPANDYGAVAFAAGTARHLAER